MKGSAFWTFSCILGSFATFWLIGTRLPCFSSPSMRAKAAQPTENVPFVIYTRIPKTGSTALANLVKKLMKQNNISLSLLAVKQRPLYLTLLNQLLMVRTMELKITIRPFFLHGHFAFLNFRRFGSALNPMYISLVRDPLDRLISYYYFRRYGDDYRMNTVRQDRVKNWELTFDECVRRGAEGCQSSDLWVQVPIFCGHAAYCRVPGSRLALETAKRRVVEDYLLVGLSEAFDESVALLEILLPRFFRGSSKLIEVSNGWRLRRTRHKISITNETREFFRRNPVWQVEQEFYDFVRDQFMSHQRSIRSRMTPIHWGVTGKNRFLNNQTITFFDSHPDEE